MGLDALPDNTKDKSSKHMVIFDEQMHQIILEIILNATRSKSPDLCFTTCSVIESQI